MLLPLYVRGHTAVCLSGIHTALEQLGRGKKNTLPASFLGGNNCMERCYSGKLQLSGTESC